MGSHVRSKALTAVKRGCVNLVGEKVGAWVQHSFVSTPKRALQSGASLLAAMLLVMGGRYVNQ